MGERHRAQGTGQDRSSRDYQNREFVDDDSLSWLWIKGVARHDLSERSPNDDPDRIAGHVPFGSRLARSRLERRSGCSNRPEPAGSDGYFTRSDSIVTCFTGTSFMPFCVEVCEASIFLTTS